MNFLDGNLANLILIASYSVLSFLFALVVTPLFYNFLTRNQIGKQIRDVGPDGKGTPLFSFLHKGKAGTPTMGGVVIWGTVIFMVLFSRLFSYAGWIDHSLLNRKETYLPIFVLVTVGILGMVDDWFNIKKIGGRKGMRVKPKLFWLTSLALIGAWWFYYKLGIDAIHIPGLEFFFPSIGVSDFSIGLWYIPLFLFIILATTNPVNQARMRKYENDFMGFSLPQALLKFDKLVTRSSHLVENSGNFYCLDRRITEKRYGENFAKILEYRDKN